jgi:hypothetical protein
MIAQSRRTAVHPAFSGAPDVSVGGGVSLTVVSRDDPTIEELKRRQLDVERAERAELAEAENEAAAERHRRRADKARYLREKLEEQATSEHEVARDQD